ncbi:OmpA family protein [Paracoccus tegillarcae]|uniref:OmpA family protein n=1 Tax=Paracoccus tegillarcae TaxID=1529068 RepID=A0A2K9EPR4_9RHOB|nr:OmpA family protein [Paracoccus tegillarcae]AUH33635.1 OmpA family protein [Paracoccus tegillarcae]
MRSNQCFLALLLCLGLAGGAVAQDADVDLTQFSRDLQGADIRDLILTVQDMQSAVSDMSGDVQDMVDGSGGNIAMRETDDSIVLSVTSDVLFAFDSADLTDPARDTLAQIATMLVGNPGGTVQVVGHTDSKGSDDYNQRLSEQRAEAVAGFLANSDVAQSRLDPVGRGEAEPVAPNEIDGADNPDGRAQNRRVEFVLPKE